MFLSAVRENFSRERSIKKISSFKSSITQIAAANREEEVELIAKEIKELIVNEEFEPGSICVVFNLIQNYSPVLRDRFKLFGIPFNLTDRFSLSTSSPVISILNFLEILDNDFYYKNIFRALNSSFIQIEEIDLANLLKKSVEHKIVSGYLNWKNRLQDAINEIQIACEKNFEQQKNLENHQKALTDIKIIYNWLKPFDNEMDPSEFYQLLCKLIYKMNIPIKILSGNDLLVEKNIKALTTFINGVKEITTLLEREFGPGKYSPLNYYLKQLKTYTAFKKYNIQEKSGYGVQITTLNEIRGLKFDHLFIGGLNDGDLPTRYTPEIFLSGSFAREEKKHQVEERYHFYQALCTWNKKLYLTYPLNDGKKELAPSNFLSDFNNLFGINKKSAENYSETIYNKEEMLKLIGNLKSEEIDKSIIAKLPIEEIKSIKNDMTIDKLRIDDPFSESDFTGYIGNNLSSEQEQKLKDLKAAQFSVTQLETYAKCPYKYLAERVLNLETIEEPTEDLEAFEFGSILHLILYEFYTELKNKKIILQGCSDKEFKTAFSLMFKIAKEKFDEIKLSSEQAFYEKEKLLGMKVGREDSLLYKFIVSERILADGYVPEFFELAFGDIENTKSFGTNEFKVEDIKLRGKIDRIDVDEKNKTVRVIDYKLSGKKPSADDLLNGLSLQLPLYLFASKELISAQMSKDFSATGAEIYSFKYSRKDFGRNKISIKSRTKKAGVNLEEEINDTQDLINICKDSIKKYVKEISKGKFHLSILSDRENKVCKYCSFKLICRIQEVD
jgi:ATP-dependent helicase/nuclease subunit B